MAKFYSLDIETTGTNNILDEMVELAIVPLNECFEPDDSEPCLHLLIKPDNNRFDPDAMRVQSVPEVYRGKVIRTKDKWKAIQEYGQTQTKALEYTLEWFEDLELAPGTRMVCVGANLQFDLGFIKQWMGNELFFNMFDIKFRDVTHAVSYINDRSVAKNMKPPFEYSSLKYLRNKLSIIQEFKHNALADAIATAEIYKKLVYYQL